MNPDIKVQALAPEDDLLNGANPAPKESNPDIKIQALAPKDNLFDENNPDFKENNPDFKEKKRILDVYNASLTQAFGDSRIRNLALSGSLGSGKSSIIRSFDKKRNEKQKFLYISLIDFSKVTTGEDNKSLDQQQLEHSLLNQILSYCTSDDLPEGSIRGIPEKFEFLEPYAKGLTLLVLSAFVLIFHEQFGALADMFGITGSFPSNVHRMLYLFTAIMLCGCVYRILLRCLPSLRVSKLLFKSNVAEAEVNLGKDQLTLDTHKFELAYILEQIGKKHDHTVVFEDLERLDPAIAVDIMTKLRELNALTNNHLQTLEQDSFQPIRFLYAISDSTIPAEYRTKYYDCIIPVVPVSHPLNSWKHLKTILGDDLKLKSEWTDTLCDILSDAIVDYRTLLSLRNEFQVLRSLCRASSAPEPAQRTEGPPDAAASDNEAFLFAITAYKVLLPEWFEHTLSPQGDGILPDFTSDREKRELKDYLDHHRRTKAVPAVQKLFDIGLLDKTSMRLIIGERALSEQWLKIIRVALDRNDFDKVDEARIRNITDALLVAPKSSMLDPAQEAYASFRNVMADRLYKLTSEDNGTQFILVANSLAAVSRKDAQEDWTWGAGNLPDPLQDLRGFIRNYFRWLDSLSGVREPERYGNANTCLRTLCNAFPESMEIILQYAKELADLAYEQTLPECADTVGRLKVIRDAFPENQEIARQYARGLVSLAYEQKLPECADTVGRLRALRDAFPKNQEIALRYARGLVNLSCEQTLPECADAVGRLKVIRDAFPENQEIALEYAVGLFNLSCEQKLPERADTIDRLKVIRDAFPENQEIALQYAMGLFNLSCKQKLPECADTIDRLKVLCDTFPENQEIALQYAKGLVNLSAKQQLPDRADTIDRLKALYDTFPENQEIAQEYAAGLFNLSNQQKLPECADSIDQLKALCVTFPENQEIALIYAKGLFNLAYEQKLPDRADTIDRLKALCVTFPENQEIARLYKLSSALIR